MTLQVTKELLKPWSPCADGYKWFLEKFPQGSEYVDVQKALRAENRFSDVRWLTNNVWANLILESPAVTAEITADHKAEALEIITATNSVPVQEVVVEGDENKNDAQIGSSGDAAQIGSSGSAAQIGSSGDAARINATGINAVVACAGIGSKARAGANGALALAWFDDAAKRTRIAVGYVGENLKPDTWYEIKDGQFVEVVACTQTQ